MAQRRSAMAGWAAICCAIDFSDASRFAMEEAADLARAFEAELVLIHVHDPGPRIEAEVVEWSRPPFALAAVDLERDICAWRREAERRCSLTPRRASGMSAMMIRALKITAERMALSGLASRMRLSLSRTG